MADISMCFNHDCPSKGLCYRYMAIPDSEYQSCCDFVVPEGKKKCDSFIKLTKEEAKQLLRKQVERFTKKENSDVRPS